MLPLIKKERQRYPLGYMRFRLWLLEKIQMRSYRQASDVIFVSNFARKFLKARIPSIEEKSRVIYHGISSHFFNAAPSFLPTLRLTPKEYILYVSVFDYYKAQLEVVREWASYQRTTGRKLCLVLVGGNQGSYFRKVVRAIEEEGLSDDVRLFKELAHTDLPGLYQNALVNLFASSCENCPNILLEMMASGRPLLCSNYGPMREIAGDIPIYFDPYETGSLSTALADVVQRKWDGSDESQAMQARARQFSTEGMVERTLEVLTRGSPGAKRCVE
jgi:glycosyltransferase involved in cell wall biosynthesis